MALVVWLLGAVDVLLSGYGLRLGVISEGNPVMARLFDISQMHAVIFSITLSGLLLYCLHRLQQRTALAGKGLRGLLFVRIVILIMHCNWLSAVL